MKKICSGCGTVNEYEAETCTECGADLNKGTYKKVCPQCGKEYPVVKEECSDCNEKLVVIGTPAAQVYDEKRAENEIPVWLWLVALLVPVIGIVVSCVYAIVREDDKKLSRQSAAQLILFSIFGQIILALIVFVLYQFFSGPLGEGMREYLNHTTTE